VPHKYKVGEFFFKIANSEKEANCQLRFKTIGTESKATPSKGRRRCWEYVEKGKSVVKTFSIGVLLLGALAV
jgi:hypothetical protein